MGSYISKNGSKQERKNNETNVEQNLYQDSQIEKTEFFSTQDSKTETDKDGHENLKSLQHHIQTDENDSLEPGGSNPTLGIQNFEMPSELQEINYEITTVNTSAIQS